MIEDRGEALRGLALSLEDVPMEWGRSDCSMLAAQWIADATGREFDWPVYSTEDEAQALINEAGGLVPLWSGLARQVGLRERVGEPEIGDVGVIHTSFGDVGGIFVHGGMFLWRHERGVTMIGPRRRTILKAWQLT